MLVAASAASYAHGVIDPIVQIGQLALERGLLLHIDGCIGAFLLPYFRRLGASVPDFDLSVPGVTSISMDLHKYGYAPKGASVIVYRDKQLRRHQLYACADWTGYAVINSTVQSTKSGGPLAAAWTLLHALGDAEAALERLVHVVPRDVPGAPRRGHVVPVTHRVEQLRDAPDVGRQWPARKKLFEAPEDLRESRVVVGDRAGSAAKCRRGSRRSSSSP